MLIQNVICLMNVLFKYFLDLFPPFYISIDNINNLYFCDIHYWEEILSVSQNNSCGKRGGAESGMTGSHVK